MKVDMLFSTNNAAGSKLISWASKFENLGLEVYPSHVAILLNDSLVVESTLGSGVKIVPLIKWIYQNKLVAKIKLNDRRSSEITDSLYSLYGKKYDWGGIMYFAWSFFRLIAFKSKLPKKNKLHASHKYFCSELAGSLLQADYTMHTPAKILKQLTGGSNG